MLIYVCFGPFAPKKHTNKMRVNLSIIATLEVSTKSENVEQSESLRGASSNQ